MDSDDKATVWMLGVLFFGAVVLILGAVMVRSYVDDLGVSPEECAEMCIRTDVVSWTPNKCLCREVQP